jgi:riboflavin synthase
MFTGLVAGTGTIQSFTGNSATGGVLRVGGVPWSDSLEAGESIAVNGVCLTAKSESVGGFEADLSPETLRRSNLGNLGSGDRINLERALAAGDRLGGHLVQGHVDGLGLVTELTPTGDFWTVGVELPQELGRYVIEKGSIAVDGISLTVASLVGNRFTVAVIPKTWELTNLSGRKVGESVNIEVDLIAKYVEKLVVPYKQGSTITRAFLEEHGFGGG